MAPAEYSDRYCRAGLTKKGRPGVLQRILEETEEQRKVRRQNGDQRALVKDPPPWINIAWTPGGPDTLTPNDEEQEGH